MQELPCLSCSRRNDCRKDKVTVQVYPTWSVTSGHDLWDVARFLCAIRCASGWADLAISIRAVSCWRWAVAHAGVWADLSICICHCTACCWRWAAAHAGFQAGLSVVWFSSTYLRMAATLTEDRAVLALLLPATSLPRTAAAASSDLTALAARMLRFQTLPLLWLPTCGYCFWCPLHACKSTILPCHYIYIQVPISDKDLHPIYQFYHVYMTQVELNCC